jgi:hypothetical protein
VTTRWDDVRFDHSGVTGTCSSCHNGSIATGKHTAHVQTNAECEECHSNVAWIPANFNHNAVIGSCSSCHDGSQAQGKPSNHFITTEQCDTCHNTNNWSNIDFNHSSANYPGDHRSNVGCLDCHTNNNQMLSWPHSNYKPDCAGCHANDFKADEHTKIASPNVRYTVSELRDCAGACHIYTDSSLTTIKTRRNSKHRTTDGDFD